MNSAVHSFQDGAAATVRTLHCEDGVAVWCSSTKSLTARMAMHLCVTHCEAGAAAPARGAEIHDSY